MNRSLCLSTTSVAQYLISRSRDCIIFLFILVWHMNYESTAKTVIKPLITWDFMNMSKKRGFIQNIFYVS